MTEKKRYFWNFQVPYVFSNDQAWANYEGIQADIFDHILAVVPLFELRVFQEPGGAGFWPVA